jgi:hypothetical protein
MLLEYDKDTKNGGTVLQITSISEVTGGEGNDLRAAKGEIEVNIVLHLMSEKLQELVWEQTQGWEIGRKIEGVDGILT